MKYFLTITLVAALFLVACNGVKRKPGAVYMPDMSNSRATETYSDKAVYAEKGIHYTGLPVAGTVSRNTPYVYSISKDSVGSLSQYEASKSTVNPVTSLTAEEALETERLYLINCAVCHGEKLDGNGPLWKGGDGPFPAKPATLVGDALYEAMAPGTMYYSITYGRNLMGSYASQLSPIQRWQMIYWIKKKQGKTAAVTVVSDSAAVKK